MKKAEILKYDVNFRCQLLGRLMSDCNYYLNNGNRCAENLWAKDPVEQIKLMESIYNSIPEEQKPTWINMQKIQEYKKAMI